MTSQGLKQLRSIRLSDQAVEQISASIMDGFYEPGSKLPSESELMDQLKVSRSSIREALRILESRGIVNVRAGSGAYVSEQPFNFQLADEAIDWLLKRKGALVQLLEVREILEGFAASLLSQRLDEQILAQLKDNLQRRTQAINAQEPDANEIGEIDFQFHELIADACGNQVVKEFICAITTRMTTSNCAMITLSTKKITSFHDHSKILEAIESKDSVLAEQMMRAHIAEIRERVVHVENSGV